MGSRPNPEINLTKQTHHRNAVESYIQAGLNEVTARQQVTKDLRMPRLERDIRRAREQALIDPLTGLYNRRAFDGDPYANPPIVGELKRVFEHVARSHKKDPNTNETITLLMLDLDYFKNYNDTFGHPAGDDALRKLAEIITKNIREVDMAFRYGGEEFAILLPLANRQEAIKAADRLRKAVRESTKFGIQLTISIGVADYPDPDHPEINSPAELVSTADKYLYEAKQRGRDQVVPNYGTEPQLDMVTASQSP